MELDPTLKPFLPKLGARKRLHICAGAPYKKALRELYTGKYGGKYWKVTDKMQTGDMVLSLVFTSPRMIIALETLTADYDPAVDKPMLVDTDTAVVFENGILADAVATRCGRDSLPEAGYISGPEARLLLDCLEDEYQLDIPWFTPDRWREVSGS
ncbi:hypothetical protein [Rhodococcus sp. NPDC004095]